jgi:hypothetical protein
MKRISSKTTALFKKGFPIFWFGFLAVFTSLAVAKGAYARDAFVLVVPCVMAVVGFFLFRRLLWTLADEVLDGGDYLLIKYRGYEERVALSNIMNVSASTNINPPRITLRLAVRAAFGSEIAFLPRQPFTLNPFAKNAVAEDLMVRVYGARPHHVS